MKREVIMPLLILIICLIWLGVIFPWLFLVYVVIIAMACMGD